MYAPSSWITLKNVNKTLFSGAVLGIFIWVGQSKVKQILGRPTEAVYVGIMGITRTVWVGQERVWVGHGLPGLIARTAFDCFTSFNTQLSSQ